MYILSFILVQDTLSHCDQLLNLTYNDSESSAKDQVHVCRQCQPWKPWPKEQDHLPMAIT